MDPASLIAGIAPKEKRPIHEYPPFTSTLSVVPAKDAVPPPANTPQKATKDVFCSTFFDHIGFDSMRRNGLHTLDQDIVLTAAGNFAVIVNYAKKPNPEILDRIPGPEGGAVGAVTVHPSRSNFVVCEKAPRDPRILIFSYPEKKVIHTLVKGAVKGFSACAYNQEGTLLATVAMEPDFVITVWSWKQEATVLRNKAFSADVYSVGFCPFNSNIVVSSGLGHIKVWEMASTFTGLKLQGTVGKFGRVEISDVGGFVTFPDGKILSGSETGSLLLWEGNLVKCDLRRIVAGPDDAMKSLHDTVIETGTGTATTPKAVFGDDDEDQDPLDNTQSSAAALSKKASLIDRPAGLQNTTTSQGQAPQGLNDDRSNLALCHEGNVEVVMLIEDNKLLMTIGDDGYVRYWDVAELDAAENNGMDLVVGVHCLKELYLGAGVKGMAVTLSKCRTHWVLLDSSGSIRTYPRWTYTQIISPGAEVPDSPRPSNALATFFSAGINSFVPSPLDHTLVAGGADGSVRLYDYLQRREVYRIDFDAPVLQLQHLPLSSDPSAASILATFQNGCVRMLKKCRDGFQIVWAFRPHESKLIGAAVDAAISQMFTVAADGTAFYFKLTNKGQTASPVGFCRLQGVPPSCLEWTQEGDACLIGFPNGEILALAPPADTDVETIVAGETFEFPARFSGLGYRQKMKPPPKEKKLNPNGQLEESSSDDDDDEEDQGPWAVKFIRRLAPRSVPIPNKRAQAELDNTLTEIDSLDASQGTGGRRSTTPQVMIEDDVTEYVIGLDKPELAYTFRCNIRYPNVTGPPPIPPTGVDPPGRVEEPIVNVAYRDHTALRCFPSLDNTKIVVVCDHCHVLLRDVSTLANPCYPDAPTQKYAPLLPVAHVRQMHDNIEGEVTGANLSYDGTFFISVGGKDGLIVTQLMEGRTAPSPAESRPIHERLPKRDADAEREALGIPRGTVKEDGLNDVDAVSKKANVIAHGIVEQKVLDDERRAAELAEGKKSLTLKKVHRVHEEYEAILAENARARGGKRLSDEEMVLDTELMELLEYEKRRRVDEAAEEYEWQVAWKEQLLKQLKSTFVDNLTFERFMLHSLDGTFSVASLRTPALTPEQEEKIKALQELLNTHGHALSSSFSPSDAQAQEAVENASRLSDEERYNASTSPTRSPHVGILAPSESPVNNHLNGTNNTTLNRTGRDPHNATKSSVKSQLDRAEERRQERNERKKGFDALVERKPKPSDPDPIGEAALRDTRENMQDYILKTNPSYRVPSHMVPTAERKAKQLIVLEHSMHHLRSQFNTKLLKLRDVKRGLCEELNEDRAKLLDIVVSLRQPISEVRAAFSLQRDEEPEKRFDATKAELHKFEKERTRAKKREDAMSKAKKGFGADLAQMEEDNSDDADGVEDVANSAAAPASVAGTAIRGTIGGASSVTGGTLTRNRSIANPRTTIGGGAGRASTFGASATTHNSSSRHSVLTHREKLEMELQHRLENVRMSELEEEEATIQREELNYQKSCLLRKIAKTTADFDDKLRDFHIERMKLDADLCMAEMRALLILREYRMLINFKNTDDALLDRHHIKEAEHKELMTRTWDLRKNVEKTREDQQALERDMGSVIEAAEEYIVENFPASEHTYLRKVFARRVKRRKQVDDQEDDDDAPTSDDEDELDDEDDDDFEEECPANCDADCWDSLLQLREGRLDCEDSEDDIRRKINNLKNQLIQLDTKDKQLRKEMENSAKAIEDFQLEKQQRLNLLETVAVLKLSQIQCLNEETMKVPPLKLNPHIVVFTEKGINSLRHRIVELAEDKRNLRRESELLSIDKGKLTRRKAKKNVEFGEWDQKVYEVQLLKFGQRVDLDALESVAVDRQTEELKEQLKLEELQWEKALRKEDIKLNSLKHDHQSRIGENTMLLKDLGHMRQEQQTLETHLTQSSGGVVSKMAGGSKVATAADRAHLKDLVVVQQTETDALKNEIAMLRRKGGHVYTPVVVQSNNYLNSTGGGAAAMSTSGGGGGYSPAAFAQTAPSSAPSTQQMPTATTNQHRFASSARDAAPSGLSPARPNGSAPTVSNPHRQVGGSNTPPGDATLPVDQPPQESAPHGDFADPL